MSQSGYENALSAEEIAAIAKIRVKTVRETIIATITETNLGGVVNEVDP